MMEKHGGGIYNKKIDIDFSISVNPFGMPKGVKKAVKKSIAFSAHYPDIHQTALLERMEETLGIPKDEIVAGAGAAELIYGLVHAVNPERALIIGPTFSEYECALEANGIPYDYYLTRKETGFEVQEDILSALEEKAYGMVFICNPNNPTGTLLKRKLLGRIAGLCEKKKIVLVLDECYMDFVKFPDKHTFLGKTEAYKQTVVLKAFTKLYAMPGLRLGYAVTSNEELRENLKALLPPWNISIPAQNAGIAALDEKKYVKKSMKFLQKERKWMEKELAALGFHVYPSRTNYILFEAEKGLWEYCIRNRFLIRNAATFEGLGEGFYRVAVRKHEENEQLLEVLGAFGKEV